MVLVLAGCLFQARDCDGCLDRDGDGLSPVQGDCDDADPAVLPGSPELCDGVDQDCDGEIDDGWYPDRDGDGAPAEDRGAGLCEGTETWIQPAEGAAWDCDDADASAHPGAAEECDGADDDCDGDVDEGVLATFHPDTDGDGHPAQDGAVEACEAPEGYLDPVEGSWDCDDSDATVHPGAAEELDRVDQDCDGIVDALAVDEAAALQVTGSACSAIGRVPALSFAGDVLDGDGRDELAVSTYSGAAGHAWIISGQGLDLDGADPLSWASDDLAELDVVGGVYLTVLGVDSYHHVAQVIPTGGDVVGGEGDVDDLLVLGHIEALGDRGEAWLLDMASGPAGELSGDEAAVTVYGGCDTGILNFDDHIADAVVGQLDAGDGLDLAVGLRSAGPSSSGCSTSDYGMVALFPDELLAAGGLYSQTQGSISLGGSGDPTQLGAALEAADFDGDGIDDLVIGAAGGQGAVYLVDGGELSELVEETWMEVPIDSLASPIRATEDSGPVGDVPSLPPIGDPTGDGLPDLVIAPAEASPGGRVYLFDAPLPGEALSLEDAAVVFAGSEGTAFGRGVAATSDLDGDGADDVAIGAPLAGVDAADDAAGTVYLFDAGGLAGVVGTDLAVGTLRGAEGALLGTTVAGGGDLDGDGIEDLALGGPGWSDTCTDSPEGVVYLVRGWGE